MSSLGTITLVGLNGCRSRRKTQRKRRTRQHCLGLRPTSATPSAADDALYDDSVAKQRIISSHEMDPSVSQGKRSTSFPMRVTVPQAYRSGMLAVLNKISPPTRRARVGLLGERRLTDRALALHNQATCPQDPLA
jgi:hypothetical protein